MIELKQNESLQTMIELDQDELLQDVIGLDQEELFQDVIEGLFHEPNEIAITSTMTKVGTVRIELSDALTRYDSWPVPTVIVSDGPYGLGLFPGDPPTHHGRSW